MNLLAFIYVVYLIFASANLNYELNISSYNVPVIADKNTNALPPDFIFSTRSANMIYHRFIRRSPVYVSGYQQKSLLNP